MAAPAPHVLSDDPLAHAFDAFQPATVSDAMFSLGLKDSALDPSVRLVSGKRILGRARTVGRTPITSNA